MQCSTEDVHSLTEENPGVGTQLCWSSSRLTRDQLPMLAIRTSCHRTAIYRPTLDPNKHAWLLTHLPYKLGLERADCSLKHVDDAQTIKELRHMCITWLPQTPTGHHFFVAGTQLGELLFHRITHEECHVPYRIKVSDAALAQVHATSWHSDVLHLAAVDAKGDVFVTTFDTSLAVQCVLSRPVIRAASNDAVCNNARICVFADQIVVVCAYPGIMTIISVSLPSMAIKKQDVPLGFLDQTVGLLLYIDDLELKLLALGFNGSYLALRFNQDMSYQPDSYLSGTMDAFITQQLDRLESTRKPSLRFFGISSSPGDLLASIAFEAFAGNQPRYLILSQQQTSVHILRLKDARKGLTQIVSSYLNDSMSTSVEQLKNLAAWSRVELMPLVQEQMDTTPSGSLQTMLFKNPAHNAKRLQCLTLHQASSSTAETRPYTDVTLLHCLLTAITQNTTCRLDTDSLDMLMRFARFICLYRSIDSMLLGSALTIIKRLQGENQDVKWLQICYDHAIKSPGTTLPDAKQIPPVDSCVICNEPVLDEDSTQYAHCARGHVWQRCTITLAPIMVEDIRSCPNCNVHALVVPEVGRDNETLFRSLLSSCPLCPHCSSKWRHRQPELGIIERDPRGVVNEQPEPPELPPEVVKKLAAEAAKTPAAT
ncbi:hypothetical protein BCR37DRAFT_237346 [Protomyces lactucae-debilis]|uniref:Transcription factor IIIC putative zinc-finger domain-containing protein n=1 Tax=Protomyces lactucae-debilis TaxID=2754530 RepID=A0A1Y2FNB9_PROLT|nr:uncharacterized protein BCR37DRAFT_237346 [Protomyces lactucae-debilis]ORY85429.1 hypothetical protein BCR37DRAFT_237346 [Protomyces lactucae-debilis]